MQISCNCIKRLHTCTLLWYSLNKLFLAAMTPKNLYPLHLYPRVVHKPNKLYPVTYILLWVRGVVFVRCTSLLVSSSNVTRPSRAGEASYLMLTSDRAAVASYRLHTEIWKPTLDVTNFGVAVVDNFLYVIGGFDRQRARHLSRVVR